MKAMAKKLKSDREELFVFGYASIPVLHVKPRDSNQRSMWFSFSVALVRYGSELYESDLGEAYDGLELPLEVNCRKILWSSGTILL